MATRTEIVLAEESKKYSMIKKARKFASTFLTIIGYVVIVIVFITPFLYVIGNSVRNSQQIWENAYPISWKSFIPFEGVTLKNYALSLGIGDVAKGLSFDISRNLLISLLSAICVVSLSLIFNTSAAYFFGRLKG